MANVFDSQGTSANRTFDSQTYVAETGTPDATAPAQGGPLVFSGITAGGFTVSYPAATDAVGVTGYEISTNGGANFVNVGNVLSFAVTGRTAATTYSVHVRAYDAAGNRSAAQTGTVTTSAAPPAAADTTPPSFTGTIAASNITSTGFRLDWPAATDAVGVARYLVSTDGGASFTDVGNVLTIAETGRQPATNYSVQVKARDAAGNESAVLSRIVTTLAATVATRSVSVPLISGGIPAPNLPNLTWAFFDQTRPGLFQSPVDQGVGAVSDAAGNFNVTIRNTSLPVGAYGYLMVSDATGVAGFAAHSFSGLVQLK